MNNKFLLLIATTALITSCSLAPKFKLPEFSIPQAFKEKQLDTKEIDGILWKKAETEKQISSPNWWSIFANDELNKLQQQAQNANQSLKIAAEHVIQSRSIAKALRGDLFPEIGLGANTVRAKSSSGALVAFGNNSGGNLSPYTLYSGQGVASYEADLFGRANDSYKAGKFDAAADEQLYKNTLLTLQADVATSYFTIRSLDAERKLLRENVKIRSEAERIMEKRFKAGDVGEQDLSRTRSELETVQADLIALDRQRAKAENALAVLLGKAPSEFSLAEMPLEKAVPPAIPSGLPSALLQRRPDIAAAIEEMKAANARIGVARAAFFPTLTLSASAGATSGSVSNLFNASAQSWAIGQTAGNALAIPIFHGGTNFANLDAVKAAYEQAVANYRQKILLAFKDVEDNLTDQKMLAAQSVKQNKAAEYATKTTTLTKKRYDEGDISYFEVADSQRTSLAAERSAVQIQGQRFIASIGMIRALGGDWHEEAGKIADKTK